MGELAGDRFEEVEMTSEAELHDWLLRHHDQHDARWLVTYKKAVPDKYITHEQVLNKAAKFMRRIP